MAISTLIDWLRFTAPVDLTIAESLPDWEIFTSFSETEALHFYDVALKLGVGRVDWHTQKPEQRRMFTFTGGDLEKIRHSFLDPNQLLECAIKHPSHLTRLDFAVDIFDVPINLSEVQALLEHGGCETPLRSWGMVVSKNAAGYRGETLYIGSRQSERFIRIYNKAAERELPGEWIRIEVELKGRYAQSVGVQMVQHGDVSLVGRSLLWETLKIPRDWYRDAVDPSNVVALDPPPARGLTDSERWLLHTALPAIEHALRIKNRAVVDRIKKAIG